MPLRTLTPTDAEYILQNQLQITQQDTLVDLGCGDGNVLVKALLQGCHRVVGIDSNPHSLKNIEALLCEHGFTARIQKTWGKPGMWGLCANLVNTRTHTTHILHIVCADLGTLQLTDLNAMGVFFSEHTIKIYVYGTIWPEQVKRNAIHLVNNLVNNRVNNLVNNMPGKTRLAWITAGRPGEPHDLGLNPVVFPFQSRASLNYLQTDTEDVAEMMTSFLYGGDFYIPMGWASADGQRRNRAVIDVVKSLEDEARALREWNVFKEECRKERAPKRAALATFTSAMLVEIPNDEEDGELLQEESASDDDDADDSYAMDFIVNHSSDSLYLGLYLEHAEHN